MKRCGSLVIPALAVAMSLVAQPTLRAKKAPATVNPETALFFEMVSMSASLELALFGVAGISDAQRAQFEALEARTRDSIAVVGYPLRDARRANLSGWPSEVDLHGRALNKIAVFRNAALDTARTLLDASQRVQFDRNRLEIDSTLGLGSLAVDDARWASYLRARTGTVSLGPTH
jgi:hypothetical protein